MRVRDFQARGSAMTLDWRADRARWVKTLERRTGKRLADWNRRIRAGGFCDAHRLRTWLSKSGVTGYSQQVLMERVGYPEHVPTSGTRLTADQYADRPTARDSRRGGECGAGLRSDHRPGKEDVRRAGRIATDARSHPAGDANARGSRAPAPPPGSQRALAVESARHDAPEGRSRESQRRGLGRDCLDPPRAHGEYVNPLPFLIRIILLVTSSTFLVAYAPPERTVAGHVITSARDPRVRIELPETVRYVGADRWILYGIADCELHAFVDADAEKRIQRLYWVQFEGYVASRPELHHTYDSPRHTALGGLDFYVDTWVSGRGDTVTKGSDLEHILALVRSRGYTMPADMMSVRLVHLIDQQKRKELMIIYSEDLATTGLAAGQLREAGSARARWSGIERDLIARGLDRVKLAPLRPQNRRNDGVPFAERQARMIEQSRFIITSISDLTCDNWDRYSDGCPLRP